jgi:hypothetical protein
MWFLHRKVILTKDNLLKRSSSEQSVDHLFIRCPFALVWQVVYFTFNILAPTNIKNFFGQWLNGIDKKTTGRIRVGVCALCYGQYGTVAKILFTYF